MIRRFKIAIVIVLAIAILVPSILLVASEMQTFIFSKDLQVEDFVADVDSYIANITDSGVPVSHIYFRVEHATPNSASHAVRFSIWHTEDTELDSMTLRFSNAPYVISLYLEASSYIWQDTQFNLDNGQAILSVKNLGGTAQTLSPWTLCCFHMNMPETSSSMQISRCIKTLFYN